MRAILHHPAMTDRIAPAPERSNVQALTVNRQRSVSLTIVCDFTFLLMTVGAGLVLNALFLAVWPSADRGFTIGLVSELPLWTTSSIAGWFLVRDGLRSQRQHALLPFDCTDVMVRHIYWHRFELILWAIAAHLVLLCLCLLMPNQPLISKLFLASVIALIALAVRKSIPAQKVAFAAATGVFSLAMLLISIAATLIR